MEHDPEIQAILRAWQPPGPPPAIDSRMLARYLSRRQPWWRRRLELRLSLPAPLLAAAALLLLLSGAWWGYQTQSTATFRAHMNGFQPVAAPTLTISEVSR